MARARRKSPSSKARVTASQRTARARRAKIVWGSLLASMTIVGGLLLVLDTNPAPRVDGLTLAPLVASGSSSNSPEAVLRTFQPLDKGNWKSIVIHHSGSLLGSAASKNSPLNNGGAVFEWSPGAGGTWVERGWLGPLPTLEPQTTYFGHALAHHGRLHVVAFLEGEGLVATFQPIPACP